MKKILLFVVLVLPIYANAAVSFGECVNAKVEQVRTGLQYNTLINFSDSSCGNNGHVCIHSEGPIDEKLSDRFLSLALSAQASKSNVNARWYTDSDKVGCVTGYPLMYDFRIVP